MFGVVETDTWTEDAIGGSVTRPRRKMLLAIRAVLSKQVTCLSKTMMMLKLLRSGCAEGVVALCDGQTTQAAFKRCGRNGD